MQRILVDVTAIENASSAVQARLTNFDFPVRANGNDSGRDAAHKYGSLGFKLRGRDQVHSVTLIA